MSRSHLQHGNLYQEGNWWRVRWWEDAVTADGTVKKVRKSSIVGPCKGSGKLGRKDAQQLAQDNILSKVNLNARTPQSLMSLAQFIEQRFEPEVVWSLKAAGKAHYSWCCAKIIPVLGDHKLRDLQLPDLQSLVRKLVTGGYSIQSATHVKNALSAIISHAKRVGCFTGENPASLVRLPRMTRKEKYSLTWEQAQKALALMPTPVKEMCWLSMATSLNVAELCGLRWKRVNLSNGFVVVGEDTIPPYSLVVRENYYKGVFDSTKTGARNRIQPVPKALIEALGAWHMNTKYAGPEDIVFCSRNGTPVDYHNVNARLFKTISAALGVKVSWHIFRHTCATLSEQIKMPNADRIALMGHSTGSMTAHYTHSDIERRREYVDQLAAGVGEKPDLAVEELQKIWGTK